MSGPTKPAVGDWAGLFPPFILSDLIDDAAFRDETGLSAEPQITLNDGAVRFKAATLFDAARALHRGDAEKAVAVDRAGRTWTIGVTTVERRPALSLRSGEDQVKIPGLLGLHPDPEARIADFGRALDHAGLPADAMSEWRARLAERPLDDEEVQRVEIALTRTPRAVGRDLSRQLQRNQCKLETIAPPHRSYYDHLLGPGTASTLTDLTDTVLIPHIARLATSSYGRFDALLLGSHESICSSSALAVLDTPDLEDLLIRAEKADTLSRVAAIDLGLAALDRVPTLEPLLIPLIESIRDLDPLDPAGRLHLLMAGLFLVGGELSRTRLFDDAPPFQRRLALFAQASLFERLAFTSVEAVGFTKWATDQRARHFYFQALVDLRAEPRWTPEFASPQQLKAEFLGRIHHAAVKYRDHVAEGGALALLLFGDGPDSLPARLDFPGSFWPGPLEGAASGFTQPVPPEWNEILDRTLGASDFTAQSIIALINLKGLFAIGGDRVERAIDLMRQAGHRLPAEVDQETREGLFTGLAGLAASTRNAAMAAELRILIRKNRIDAAEPPGPHREWIIAVTAAAAHPNYADWARFIGEWGSELAFTVDDISDAEGLLADFDMMCLIEPRLRTVLGGPSAALDAFIQSGI